MQSLLNIIAAAQGVLADLPSSEGQKRLEVTVCSFISTANGCFSLSVYSGFVWDWVPRFLLELEVGVKMFRVQEVI